MRRSHREHRTASVTKHPARRRSKQGEIKGIAASNTEDYQVGAPFSREAQEFITRQSVAYRQFWPATRPHLAGDQRIEARNRVIFGRGKALSIGSDSTNRTVNSAPNAELRVSA
jgi:hypothetical protein